MKDKCPKCGQIGVIVLEKSRKKHESKIRWSLKKNTEYHTSRKPGRYFRVHHYLKDKNGYFVRGKNGRPKSRFCYIGNFETALNKLKNLKTVLDLYDTSEAPENSKINRWLIWSSHDLQYMENTYKQGKKINLLNLKPDDIIVINSIIGDTKLWDIVGNEVLCKYA